MCVIMPDIKPFVEGDRGAALPRQSQHDDAPNSLALTEGAEAAEDDTPACATHARPAAPFRAYRGGEKNLWCWREGREAAAW